VTQQAPVSFTPQLSRSWQRMKLHLFAPFDLGRWFVLGFGAFLAGLADSGHDGLIRFSDRLDRDHWQESTGWLDGGWQEFLESSVITGLVLFGVFLALVLGIAMLWLSSRGRFVFLDNLVTGRAEVKKPWSQFKAQGDSLFLWQLVFWLVCLVVFGGYALFLVVLFVPLGSLGMEGEVALPLAILAGSVGFVLVLTAAYIEFFLHHFVTAIMYREGLTCTGAWGRFKPLFSNNPGAFVAAGIFYLIIAIIGGMALVLGGLMTCCLGLALLMLPYIGSVVSLPLSVTLRYWTLEFLGQFGPEFQVLGPVPAGPARRSIQDDGDGTVVGAEDIGEDPGADQPGPQGS
jgi:hypothetical protein